LVLVVSRLTLTVVGNADAAIFPLPYTAVAVLTAAFAEVIFDMRLKRNELAPTGVRLGRMVKTVKAIWKFNCDAHAVAEFRETDAICVECKLIFVDIRCHSASLFFLNANPIVDS
jgi:hypothetical protein